jgi:hypothetical protein
MAFVQAEVNDYAFSEVTDGVGLGDKQVKVINTEGRTILNYEIMMQATAPFYCGELRKYGGLIDDGLGYINIEHRRIIRTKQIKTDTTTFTAGEEVYFQPGGASAAGVIVNATDKAAGSIKFGRITKADNSIGGSTGAYTYLEIRPYAYDDSRILEV